MEDDYFRRFSDQFYFILIIMMELFYNEYGYHHWVATGGGYSPYFGVIGPFIGAIFILAGSFVRRK